MISINEVPEIMAEIDRRVVERGHPIPPDEYMEITNAVLREWAER